MTLTRWRIVLWAAVSGLATTLQAQQAAPHIGYVYPAGGRQGSVFQVAVGGQFLDGVTNVHLSGAGAEGVVVDFNKPMPQGQFNTLRDRLKELQDRKQAAARDAKRGVTKSTNQWTTADETEVSQIRQKILKNPPNRNATMAIAEVASVRITLATNAEPGEREIRLGTPLGLSNPLKFHVGSLPEYSKPSAKAPNPDADRFLEKVGRRTTSTTVKSELRVTLPAVVNGQILPGAVDRFRFTALKGQRLVVAANARGLIPYLPDAVPGWFQATLALYNSKGKELAYDDDYRFSPDPVLFYEIPADGEYFIEVKDSIYRGREDFVYRITIGELPFVTSIFPLGGSAGKTVAFNLKGWNLTVTNVEQSLPAKPAGTLQLALPDGAHFGNPLSLIVDELPECFDVEPNNTSTAAQNVSLPVIINGRIADATDTDVFSFNGQPGDEIVVEVNARRLGSPLDSAIRLTDQAGRQIAVNDDHEDKATGLHTHHADSWLRVVLPAAGKYFVFLSDTQRKGGADFAYRLRVSRPQPDFALRIVPSSITIRPGASMPLTVYALRKDGCTNAIALTLSDAAAGFTIHGGRIPANQDQVRMTLTAPTSPQEKPCQLHIDGSAVIQGQEITRAAVPAEDMMQAFAYRHLVPAGELEVAVAGRSMNKAAMKVLGKTPIRIPVGGTVSVQISVPGKTLLANLQLELSDPPEGISLKSVSPSGWNTELILQSDPKTVKPGLAGNLIVNLHLRQAGDAKGGKPNAARRRLSFATLPAIPFEVVR